MIFLDFESHYDKEYSLAKMPMWEYIRDDRFRLLGCAAWATGMQEIKYLHTHGECVEFFKEHNLPEQTVVAQNAAFDCSILTHHFDLQPAYIYDTKLMARYLIAQGLLPPEQTTSLSELTGRKGDTWEATGAGGDTLAAYAINDLKLEMELFTQFFSQIPRMELDLMDLHARIASAPIVRLDKPLLQKVAAEKPPALAVELRKRKPFLKALAGLGIEPEYKPSPTNPEKQTYAFAKTDAFMQRLAAHNDPRVRKLHELRTQGNSNIKQTRAQRFLDIGAPLPVHLLYYGAHTGRSSGEQKLNQQNLPRGGEHRRSMLPPPGHKFIKIDLSQVEVRTLGYGAGDQELLGIFAREEDPYIDFASKVMYHKPADEVTKEERRICKAPILACGFGQGNNGLVRYAAGMGVTLTPAQATYAVNGYRRRFKKVVQFWDRLMRQVQRDGEVILPSGRKILYPSRYYHGRDLYYQKPVVFSKKRKKERDQVKLWPGLLAENYAQALARDVVMWQTLELARRWWVVLSVHDEALLSVPEDQADEALQDALKVFATSPPWAPDLPVKGEGKVLDHYE